MDNIIKTINFDFKTLRLHKVSLATRLLFLYRKYVALTQILLLKRAKFKIGKNSFLVSSLSELGTLHSSIIDFHEDIVVSGLLESEDKVRVVDVGANIGQFCNAVLFFYPEAEVISFEPDPDVVKKFKQNINQHEHNVTLHGSGLGDKASKRTFYRTKLPGMSSFVLPEAHNIISKAAFETKTLDSFELTDISLLKIDVEGFEFEVIKGAAKTLTKSNYMLVELSLARHVPKTNLSLLSLISSNAPDAHIVKFGRPLGKYSAPDCQDVVMALK